YNRNRRNIAALYTSLLGRAVKCPVEMRDRTHVYHQYTIMTPERAGIIEALRDNRISSVVYYPAPLHFQEAFKYLGYEAGDFPESEAAAKEVLSLPIYPELDPGKVQLIAGIILSALNN
ncbi:MAG TPA: hypothetical protein ENH01_08950, partial [Nitrospirae bacterium]|nr:hypothetical protein [Nitrospirota bacterium]